MNTLLAEDDPGPKRVSYLDLVLARAKVRGHSIFRLADDPEKLLVNDHVMRVLWQNVPVEGWASLRLKSR